MTVRILFPRLFIACFAFCLAASAVAQTSEKGSRQTSVTLDSTGSKRLETEPAVPPTFEERRPRTVAPVKVSGHFDHLLLTAIQSHLGASYQYNRTGPESFDCSGFVWRAFQDIGLNFQRGPASSYWASFAPPAKEEQFKFGTLVFFSGLTHVGIVADEHGFYHSSRHSGVIYSPFNDYWLSRIDGFRRVPIKSMPSPTASAKPRAPKPAVNVLSLEEENQP